ncbi:type IV secretion system protein VirB6 [Candidatus Xenohaliotis californiensis]|uniref:Type IV secretion system protein VirB6 n=2 Tax=Candidatus Xenohaliotis californiensis TaxID=84677 RepID=A0ABP0EWC0_9RICK|nr:type IV secretion system protein VirB6 [Candidatus Xenohaliotis californiensis]
MILSKLLPILLMFLLGGCIIDPVDDKTTINTGDEHGNCYMPTKIGNRDVNIEVFANPQDSSSYDSKNGIWVDSGVKKSDLGDLKSVIIKYSTGKIELCEGHDKDFEISYSMCSDGSAIDYSKIKATKFGFESSAEEMCPKTKELIKTMSYKTTGIFLEPNDLVTFSPIRSDISLGDCNNISSKFGQADVDLYNKKYTAKQLCEGVDISDGSIDKLTIRLSDDQGKLLGLTTNDPSPKGNKIDIDGQESKGMNKVLDPVVSELMVEHAGKPMSILDIHDMSCDDANRKYGVLSALSKKDNFANFVMDVYHLIPLLPQEDDYKYDYGIGDVARNKLTQYFSIFMKHIDYNNSTREFYIKSPLSCNEITTHMLWYIFFISQVHLGRSGSFTVENVSKFEETIKNNYASKGFVGYKSGEKAGWLVAEVKDASQGTFLPEPIVVDISTKVAQFKSNPCTPSSYQSKSTEYAKFFMNFLANRKSASSLDNMDLLTKAYNENNIFFTDIDKANYLAIATNNLPTDEASRYSAFFEIIRQKKCSAFNALIDLLDKFSKKQQIILPPSMLYFRNWIQGKEFALANISSNSLSSFKCSDIQPNAPYDQWDLYTLNTQCNTMLYSFNMNEWNKSIKDMGKDIASSKVPRLYASSLIAKIGSNDTSYNAVGDECWPDNTKNAKCSAYSNIRDGLQMYTQYMPKSSGELMLIIKDQYNAYSNNMGGYHINIKQKCPYTDGERLYAYIGINPSGTQPGDSSTISIIPGQGNKTIDFTPYNDNDHLYFAIKPRATNNHKSSKGKYNVMLQLQETTVVPSIAIGQIFKIIRNVLAYDSDKSYVKRHFESLVRNMGNAIKATLVLYITYTGLGYVTGLIPVSKEGVVISLVRIGFVAQLAAPNSWQFFNKMFFESILPFINTLISMLSLSSKPTDDFTFFDSTFGALFSAQAWRKMLALFLSGPIGFVIFIILILAYWKFTKLCLKGLLMYAMAMMAIAFLITLFPLFLIFILFKQTKYLFDAWLKMIVGYIAQPAFYFISVGFMIQLLEYAVEDLFYFKLCNLCVFGLVIGILPGILSFIPPLVICFADGWLPKTYIDYSNAGGGGWQHIPEYFTHDIGDFLKGEFFGMPFSINVLFFFVVALQSMDIMAKVSQTMASCMVGFSYAHQGISSATNAMIAQGKGFLGIDQKSKDRRQMSKDLLNRFKKNVSSEKTKRSDNKSSIDSKKKDMGMPANDLDSSGKINSKRSTNNLQSDLKLGGGNDTDSANKKNATRIGKADTTNLPSPDSKTTNGNKNDKIPRK